MPSGKIPFGSAVVKNTDEDFVLDGNVSFIDGYINQQGVSVKRPGLATELTVTSTGGVNGLFWWGTQNKVVIVTAGKCYVVSKSGSTHSVVDATSAVPSTGKIYFAYDANYFYLSDGGSIMYSNGAAASLTDVADVDAPTACTHIEYLDSYIIGNNSNKRFYWSAIEDGLTWDALDFASASGNPDNLTGLCAYNRELFLFGGDTTEIWYNDGETPFARADGGFIQRGCIAPSSILKTKSGVFWLDSDRNLAFSTGREPKILSNDYKKVLDSIRSVTDCEINFIEWQGIQFAVMNFISDEKTFVYNLSNDTWSDWGSYNASTGTYGAWRGRTYLYAPSWGLHLVGDKDAGIIYAMSDSYYADGSNPIRLYKRTGFINHGNDSLKRSNRVTLKIKRGYGDITSSTSPKLMIRYRNDGSSNWSNIKEVDLGKAGDGVHVVDVYLRGAYYTRQYELSCTDNVPVAFLDADEDYTVLR